jgi:hypothetical protein
MSDPCDPSKLVSQRRAIHRSDVAGAIVWLLAGSFVAALIVSPGGDPYWMTLFTAVLFPASIVAYWMGFRHGRRVAPTSSDDTIDAEHRGI